MFSPKTLVMIITEETKQSMDVFAHSPDISTIKIQWKFKECHKQRRLKPPTCMLKVWVIYQQWYFDDEEVNEEEKDD